ncbi:hypothetical protein [Saccharothrix coeruleofusca]|uniref:Uncharacterized protein n=1 Tax=Saccharothrix coeruleofusca TaxID=33919 RepID=A0A918EDT7_9PSEU|nr:hypothetical protein [Saccharothrix coeruleofusca]MBP2338648.1 hypothetical protein [Saccharothrix coeruleofusca]GGP46943.1 hypothetical protein GCM10010185_18380 [Saccharothrix coeruleofusca]
MPLHQYSDVSVEAWIEMSGDVSVTADVNADDDRVTLTFGHNREYVMVMDHRTLTKVAEVSGQALGELAVHTGE